MKSGSRARTLGAAVAFLAAHAAAEPRDVAEPRGGVEPHVAAEQQLVGALALGIEGIGYGDPAPVDYSVTVGTDLRVSGGPSDFPLTYAIGGDWRLGATSPGGFAYALTMWPVGIGVLVGETFFFGVLGGAGVSGVTTRVPASGQLETEARMLLDLPGPFLFIGSARTTWLAADERQDGAKTASFADESRAQLGVRIGHEGHSRKIEFGRGFFLAFEVREAFDTRGYGVTLAHQIDDMHAP